MMGKPERLRHVCCPHMSQTYQKGLILTKKVGKIFFFLRCFCAFYASV